MTFEGVPNGPWTNALKCSLFHCCHHPSCFILVSVFFNFFFAVWGIEPMVSCTLGKYTLVCFTVFSATPFIFQKWTSLLKTSGSPCQLKFLACSTLCNLTISLLFPSLPTPVLSFALSLWPPYAYRKLQMFLLQRFSTCHFLCLESYLPGSLSYLCSGISEPSLNILIK